jgi:hypothetical protein
VTAWYEALSIAGNVGSNNARDLHLYPLISVLCCSVEVEALLCATLLFKVFCALPSGLIVSELIVNRVVLLAAAFRPSLGTNSFLSNAQKASFLLRKAAVT